MASAKVKGKDKLKDQIGRKVRNTLMVFGSFRSCSSFNTQRHGRRLLVFRKCDCVKSLTHVLADICKTL